jgi:uncharacterized membrane protein
MTVQSNGTKKLSAYAHPTKSSAVQNAKIDLYKAFWIFLIGSITGFVVETIWCIIRNGTIENRSCMVIGTFNAIYGLGALLFYLGNRPAIKSHVLRIYAFGAVTSTIVEFSCSLFQETIFGSVSWDYSAQPFNINGRISLLYSVFWGLLAIFWFKLIQPMFEKLISKIPTKVYKPLTCWLAVFLAIDIVLSIAAVARWGVRIEGIQSTNLITAIIDNLFTDEVMQKIYPNMLWRVTVNISATKRQQNANNGLLK